MATDNDPDTRDNKLMGTEREKFKKPSNRLNTRKAVRRIILLVRFLVLIPIFIYILFPMYWLISSALKPRAELFLIPPNLYPANPTISNIISLFTETQFPAGLLNSIVVSSGATATTIFLALLGGYGLARSNFKGRRNLARLILFTYMFPHVIIGIPLYLVYFRAGLLNTRIGLIIAHTTLTLPFALWLMWQYFQTIPVTFEEAAWICGASRKRTFVEIVLPLATPGLIAVAIFSFAVSWSDFTLAKILMTEQSMLTFPVMIESFMTLDKFHWGLLNASGLIVMIPAFLLVYYLQKYILVGFTLGE